MSEEYLSIDYSSFLDEDMQILHYYANFDLRNIETDESSKIGSAVFYIYNTYLIGDWDNSIANWWRS